MQATFPLRRSAIQPILIALAFAAVLILSAVGGYWLKTLSSQAATVTVAGAASTVAVPANRSSQGETASRSRPVPR